MAAAASSSSFARAGKWGSVDAESGVRFRVRGGLEVLPGHVGRLSAVANLGGMTWHDVVKSHLRHHPLDRDAVWYVDGRVLGIHIPLSQPLRIMLHAGQQVEIDVPGPLSRRVWDEHEKIKYALAALRCGRTWPAWGEDDVDPLNLAVLGGWDEKREGTGSTVTTPDQDNSIGNLVGLRKASGHVVYVNIHQFREAVLAAIDRLDPERPNMMVDMRDPVAAESLGSTTTYKFRKLSPAWFLYNLLGVVISGFTMASVEDRFIQSYTHILSIIDLDQMVKMVEREVGPAEKFTLIDPELPAIPDYFEECVDTSFGKALVTVEIEYQNREAAPSRKRALDSAEFQAASLNAEDMLSTFLEEAAAAKADGWGEDDEESWNTFIEEVRDLLPDSPADADRLVAQINKSKKRRAGTSARMRHLFK